MANWRQFVGDADGMPAGGGGFCGTVASEVSGAVATATAGSGGEDGRTGREGIGGVRRAGGAVGLGWLRGSGGVVRCGSNTYLVETKAQGQVNTPNVKRKKHAAVSWCDNINGLTLGQLRMALCFAG